jgi:hypothetical protein
MLCRLGVPAVVADAKYGTTVNYLYLGQPVTPAFVPTTRFGNLRKDIWGREYFVWLPEDDAYRCPAGQKLRRYANVRGTRRVQYRAPRGSCLSCPASASPGAIRPLNGAANGSAASNTHTPTATRKAWVPGLSSCSARVAFGPAAASRIARNTSANGSPTMGDTISNRMIVPTTPLVYSPIASSKQGHANAK